HAAVAHLGSQTGYLHGGLLHAGRYRWALLALRRYHLDLPVPLAVFDRSSHRVLAMSQHSNEHPVDSVKTYGIILVTLLICTIVTSLVARIDLGAFNTIVALGIACTKMMLVALFFMHIRHSTKLTKLVVVGGLMWLAIMLGM